MKLRQAILQHFFIDHTPVQESKSLPKRIQHQTGFSGVSIREKESLRVLRPGFTGSTADTKEILEFVHG